MSTPLLTGCADCEKLSMKWTWGPDRARWFGRCQTKGCLASSWASTLESQRLDERAEEQARG